METKETNDILIDALMEACRFLRKYPSVDMDAYINNHCEWCLLDAKSDPVGNKWLDFFIDLAIKDGHIV